MTLYSYVVSFEPDENWCSPPHSLRRWHWWHLIKSYPVINSLWTLHSQVVVFFHNHTYHLYKSRGPIYYSTHYSYLLGGISQSLIFYRRSHTHHSRKKNLHFVAYRFDLLCYNTNLGWVTELTLQLAPLLKDKHNISQQHTFCTSHTGHVEGYQVLYYVFFHFLIAGIFHVCLHPMIPLIFFFCNSLS